MLNAFHLQSISRYLRRSTICILSFVSTSVNPCLLTQHKDTILTLILHLHVIVTAFTDVLPVVQHVLLSCTSNFPYFVPHHFFSVSYSLSDLLLGPARSLPLSISPSLLLTHCSHPASILCSTPSLTLLRFRLAKARNPVQPAAGMSCLSCSVCACVCVYVCVKLVRLVLLFDVFHCLRAKLLPAPAFPKSLRETEMRKKRRKRNCLKTFQLQVEMERKARRWNK